MDTHQAIYEVVCATRGEALRDTRTEALRKLEGTLREAAESIAAELRDRIKRGVDACTHINRQYHAWGSWSCPTCKASWYSDRYDGEPSPAPEGGGR
jgi:hypothetical protein